MNEYAQISHFKAYPDAVITGTGDDTLIKEFLTDASRLIDEETRRFYYERLQTRKFDCPASPYRDLMFDWTLLSLSTLTNGNAVPIAAGDYFLYPDPNTPPFMWLELDKSSGIAWEYSDTPQQAIQVVGLWGWHEEYSQAWGSSGDTTEDNPLTAVATTINVNVGTNFEAQQMLKIESEQVYVVSVALNALTVIRACNGTTAAAHLQNTVITIWRAQSNVKRLTMRIAHWFWGQRAGHFGKTGHTELGIVEIPEELPLDVQRQLRRLRRI